MSWGNSIADAYKKVSDKCELVLGGDSTITLDLDTADSLTVYESQIAILNKAMPEIKETTRWKSKGGVGWHVVIALDKPLTYQERAGMQAMLGSDLKRELLGFLNGRKEQEPFCLFKPRSSPGEAEVKKMIENPPF